MNWTKIKYDSKIHYMCQETLPKAGVPIVCCRDGNFNLKISTLNIDREGTISIEGTCGIDGVWWAYLDMDSLPIEVTQYALSTIGINMY